MPTDSFASPYDPDTYQRAVLENDGNKRLAALELAAGPPAPLGQPAPGLLWADEARRLVAFGDKDCRWPGGMDALAAWKGVQAASRRLCDALAHAPDGTATGLPGQWRNGRTPSGRRCPIPARFFHAHVGINGAAWATLDDDAVPMEQWVAWQRSDEPTDWANVLIPEAFARRLVTKPEMAEAVDEMNRLRSAHPAIKYDDAIEQCRKNSGCTKAMAEAAWKTANGGVTRQGRRAR